jgi:hypothetical protein
MDIVRKLNKTHIICWLIKDAFWCMHLIWAATFMIIPTLIFNALLIFYDKSSRIENITVLFWVLMNVFWMLHELHNTPFWLVYIPMILGAISTIKLIKSFFDEIR